MTTDGDLLAILAAAVRCKASDVHLAVSCPPLVRVSGSIAPLPDYPALDTSSCQRLVYSILTEKQRADFEQRLELDASFTASGLGRFRMSALVQQRGVEAVLRLIPDHIPPPEALGLDPAAMRLADLPSGLVLVTGPTGSGKSTTLACMIESINQRHSKHILTIEDPIEFQYVCKRSLIRQREVGPHTRSFQAALRHGLRQDPNVIMVGEIRDLETVSLALTAAETGHLCFTTLHTQSAAQTIDRIIDVFPHERQQQVRIQLAATLKAVVSQVLLRRMDGAGRVAARELLVVTPAVSNLIREGKTHMIASQIETGAKLGMCTMARSLAELSRRGLIEGPEAAGPAMTKFDAAQRSSAVLAG